MVSEEVHINPALETAGIRTVETDLGEIDARIEHQLQAVEELFRSALDRAASVGQQ